jgi:hypothetical protein
MYCCSGGEEKRRKGEKRGKEGEVKEKCRWKMKWWPP